MDPPHPATIPQVGSATTMVAAPPAETARVLLADCRSVVGSSSSSTQSAPAAGQWALSARAPPIESRHGTILSMRLNYASASDNVCRSTSLGAGSARTAAEGGEFLACFL
jgi:hypothetical protein